jgi:hypothetical protein
MFTWSSRDYGPNHGLKQKLRLASAYFDDAFRQRMARVQGLFSQEDGPNSPKFPDFSSTGRVM